MIDSIKANVKKQLEYRKEYKELCKSSGLRFSESERMHRTETYINFSESTKVDRNIILYESYWGRGLTDSPFALFKVLLHDARFAGAKHVWAVDDLQRKDHKIEQYKEKENVIFVDRESDEYLKYLAMAGILINNVTFPSLFIKRPGQLYINTWHGTPLKKMGYSMAGGIFGSRYMVRNFLQADYLVAPNDILENMYLKDYKMDGIMPGKIIREGYPRIDLTFNTDRDSVLDELEFYGVGVDRTKQIILYAPTWRQTDRQELVVDVDELISFKEALEEHIDTDRYQVLVKPHNKLYEEVKDDEKYKGKLVPASVDANELLSAVDILISDYSSIFFDYMAVDRPILFYITDLDEYSESRGLDMGIESLPGPVNSKIEDIADQISSIDKVSPQYRQRYETLKREICPYDDGSVSERIVDCIAGNEKQYNIITADSSRKKILLSLGTIKENGMTDSVFSLLKQINYNEYDVTLYAAVDQTNDELVRKVNNDIDDHVRVMLKMGSRAETSKEAATRAFHEKFAADDPQLQSRFPETMIKREFTRIFGGAEFDYAVDFNGCNIYNALLMLQSSDSRKSIWMHKDFKSAIKKAEKGKKKAYQNLKYCVSLYPRYDSIISDGKEMMEVNRKNISTTETADKFTWANVDENNSEAYREFICAISGQHV